jgi:pyruvate dehydrogenase phosphatase
MRCLRGEGGGDGLLWHTDLKSYACGDYSIAVVQANSLLEDQGQVFTSPSATYVGVYDGHGGPEASRFLTHHLFPFLHSEFCFFLFFCFLSFIACLVHGREWESRRK